MWEYDWVSEPPVIAGGWEPGVPADGMCRQEVAGDRFTWRCSRTPHDSGRHLAGDGAGTVYAAWPGGHPPVAVDLAGDAGDQGNDG